MIIERYLPIWGGAENQLSQLAPYLVQHGYKVTILTRRWHVRLKKTERLNGINIVRVGIPGEGNFATLLFILSTVLYFFKTKNQFEFYHSHGAIKMGALASVFAKLFKINNISKIATAGHAEKLMATLMGRLIILLFRNSNYIIAMSEEIEKEMQKIGVGPDRIARIPNGVDCNRFNALDNEERKRTRKKNGLFDNDTVLVFSGRLVYRKGLDLIIGVWENLLAVNPRIKLLVVGSGLGQADSVEQELKRKINMNGLRNIIFIGQSDNPEKFLSMADIFVLPSRKEGFPNTLLEAMASKLAIVASNIGGVIDIVIDEKNGLLFDSEDHEALKNNILKLCNDPQKRTALGRSARETVRKNYSFESISNKYAHLYARMLN